MSARFTISAVMPATPQAVYDAWLDGRSHSKMTGAKAKASKKVGGAFAAWAGYATGSNLELVPGKRIVQSWRTADFAEGEPDSRLAITLTAVQAGTKLTLAHSRIDSGADGYRDGWREYYFEPMKAFFAGKKGG